MSGKRQDQTGSGHNDTGGVFFEFRGIKVTVRVVVPLGIAASIIIGTLLALLLR